MLKDPNIDVTTVASRFNQGAIIPDLDLERVFSNCGYRSTMGKVFYSVYEAARIYMKPGQSGDVT